MNIGLRSLSRSLVTGLLAVVAGLAAADEPSAGEGTFRDRVAPIFERHCVRCHNDEDRKGGLSLATADSARKGGDSGVSLIPANPDESLLQYVVGNPPEMPKNAAPLSAEQVAALREWIKSGADWPAT